MCGSEDPGQPQNKSSKKQSTESAPYWWTIKWSITYVVQWHESVRRGFLGEEWGSMVQQHWGSPALPVSTAVWGVRGPHPQHSGGPQRKLAPSASRLPHLCECIWSVAPNPAPCLLDMQSASWETLGWKKHKLESWLPGEISITSDTQVTPP